MICLLVPQMVEGFFIFDLNNNRKGLVLKGILTDKIALDKTESEDILFAEGLSIITDLKQGPDGYPYSRHIRTKTIQNNQVWCSFQNSSI